MTDALITDLSKISALKVISRTSVMRYKDTEKSIPEIAKELGVDALLEGSVLQSGNRVRITAQLIDGKTDEHLWAENYTRELEDVLALHSEVARAIAEEIQVTVTADEASRLSGARRVDPEALQAYLKGQYFWNKRTADGFDQASESFQLAIDIEPNYALAHAGLANTFVLMGASSPQAYEVAEAAALRAIEIDDSLAEPLTALGWVQVEFDWDWSSAERSFQRAIALNPSYATAHQWYAELLTYLDRHEEALREIRLAREIDPLSLIVHAIEGVVLHRARRYDEAIEELEQVLEKDPDFARAHSYLSAAYFSKGMFQEALREWEKGTALYGSEDVSSKARLGMLHAAMGQRDEALEIVELLKSGTPSGRYRIAEIYLLLGDKEQAMAWLEEAFEERDTYLTLLKIDPTLDPLRDDPRFQELLEQMNFPE